MAFVEVPFPQQSLGETNALIRENFNILRDPGIAENHYDVNDSRAGKHIFCNFPDIANAPSAKLDAGAPITAADEIAIFSNPVGGVLQLFARASSNGAIYQLTGMGSGSTVIATNGASSLPGGVQLRWGIFVGSGSGGSPVTVNYAVPYTTAGLGVVIQQTAIGSAPSVVYATNFTGTTSFQVYGAPAVNHFYISLGY